MKRSTAVIGGFALVFGVGAVLAQSGGGGPEDNSAAIARGAQAWAENCGACHNVRSPSELGDASWGVAAAHMRVRANIPGNVARDIVAFLQSSNDPAPARVARPVSQLSTAPAATAATAATVAAPTAVQAIDIGNGSRIYAQTCVACHGADGTGALPGTPDFTAASGPLAKSDEELIRIITEGVQTPGSPIPMPPHGGNHKMTDQDVIDTLAYLRSEFGSR